MEYSIFPTANSAVKWARENITGNWSLEVVTEPKWVNQYSEYLKDLEGRRYIAGEYWLHYRNTDIRSD